LPGSGGFIECDGCERVFAVTAGATEDFSYRQFACLNCGELKSDPSGVPPRVPRCPSCRNQMTPWTPAGEGIDEDEFLGGPCPNCAHQFEFTEIILNMRWD
jgi:hypothetical protein